MKKETVGIVAACGMLIGLLCFTTLTNDKRLMAASDCVSAKWEEYEDQTGKMPPTALEQAWYRDCVQEVKDAEKQ